MGKVRVAVLSGSASDKAVVDDVVSILTRFGVEHEAKVLSAHRNREQLEKYLERSEADVFIAIAGLAAHLPGVIASATLRPVIGVPVAAKLGGLDALLSIVQMPPGVPVGAVGIDNGRNAALLAVEILGLSDAGLRERLAEYRREWSRV